MVTFHKATRLLGIVCYQLILTLLLVLVSGEVLVRLFFAEFAIIPSPNIYEIHPNSKLGYTLRKNFDGVALGKRLKTNSLGFRGPEWNRRKPPATVRIAIIGDSHAFGYGVAFEDTFGEKLAKILTQENFPKRFEVLNFAVSGYNSIQELEVFREYVPSFQPDILAILVCNNDHDPPLVVDPDGWLNYEDNAGNKDRIVDALYSNFKIQNNTLYKRSYFTRFVTHAMARFRAGKIQKISTNVLAKNGPPLLVTRINPNHPIDPSLKVTVVEPLTTMIESAKRLNIKPVLLLFAAPTHWRETIAGLADNTRTPLIEILKAFPSDMNYYQLIEKHSLGWDGHSNEATLETWASFIYREGKKIGLW